MEANRPLTSLVLVLGCALGSGSVSASAPARSPQPEAPAQTKYSRTAVAQVVVVEATEIVWKTFDQADPRAIRLDGFRLPLKRRSLQTEFQSAQPYLIVDFP